MVSSTPLLSALLSATAVFAQQAAWGQCGGDTWTGVTTCVAGFICKDVSPPYYSQCIPDPGYVSSAVPTPNTAVVVATTTTKATSPSTTVTGPGTTLQSGYYWIRAVASPNFHKYLQSKPLYSESVAVLESYTTAGQFNVVSGQLVQLVSGGFLYGVVEKFNNSTQVKLQVSFSKEKNTYGTFQWSGDALQWTATDVKRQNLSAWLVCGAQSLWVNLGAYGYMTPAGCADQTIHYYNDKTAVP
ncbi:hypothetical protein BGZ60DRAFT_433951 [Tricladium varicosporioides]|nr:hypothetical protein BGZ60DRAFT_433951 [Hymenoscyphus varicosporioides]